MVSALRDWQIGIGCGKFWSVRPAAWKASTTSPDALCLIVGRPGIQGCATVRLVRGELDVAIRAECMPEDVASTLRHGGRLGEPDAYYSLKNLPGVGDYIVELVENAVRENS